MFANPLRRAAVLFVALGAALLCPRQGLATVVAPVELEDLARGAEVIVRGTVQSSSASWTARGKKIRTLTRVAVQETLKGKAPASIEVTTPGGTVGNITQRVQGAARFEQGEEVYLFLDPVRGAKNRFQVTGMALGKFKVEAAPQGPLVTQDRDGLFVALPRGVEPIPPFEPVAEASFKKRIQVALQNRAEK